MTVVLSKQSLFVLCNGAISILRIVNGLSIPTLRSRMIKALQLIFSPMPVWQKIAEKNRSFFFVLLLYVVPMLGVAAAGEGYGLLKWGERRGEFGYVAPVSKKLALRYEVVQTAFHVAVLFLGAYLVLSVARSFQLNTTFSQAFSTIAYGCSPMFLVQLADGHPKVNTWICWAIGGILAVMILYHGVALMLKPDQTKGFGIYVTTSLFVLIFSGVAHFASWYVLHEKLLQTGIPGLGI